jgi:arginyl-tRNA synthetase
MMREYLAPLVLSAVRAMDPSFEGAVVFEAPRMEEHGDLATPVALGLAKSLKQQPRKIAEAIVATIELDPLYCSCSIAGPGFINFRFTASFFTASLRELLRAGEDIGRHADNGVNANVEYVSANPTGLLHLGHGRQAAIGDTAANLLQWSGYHVDREYYFNNAGRQMRQLAESIFVRYRQALGDDVAMPEDGYNGEYVKEIGAEIVAMHGAGLRDTEDRAYFQKYGEQWCFARIKATLERMHVHHDVYFNEDTLYADGKIDDVIAEFRRQGIAYDKDGAVFMKLSDFGLEDRVIVKSTGEPTYRLPDIAYHREKFRRGYDLIVDIFGSDHQVTIPDVLAGVRALGFDSGKVKVFIHGWVNLIENGESVKMSKRTGKAYLLDDLIDEFGADVVRFFLVMRSASAPLDFDLDLARDHSEKNPVFYLQYGYARIAGLLRVAEREGVQIPDPSTIDVALLAAPEEQRLIRTLLQFPGTVKHAALAYEPHVIPEYLKGVASDFHKFYHDHRVIGVDAPLMLARLALCICTLRVLRNGLKILGISAPERMEKGSTSLKIED